MHPGPVVLGGSATAEVAHAGSGSEVARVDSGQEVVHARDGAEVTPAGDGLEDTRARGVDGWRRVHGERRNIRADGLEAPGRSEGNALGSIFGRWLRATGPEEQHGQAQHERPVRVSDFDFILRIRLIGPLILLTSVLVPPLPAPGPSPGMQPRLC